MVTTFIALCFAFAVTPGFGLEGETIPNLLVTNPELFNTLTIPDVLDFGLFSLCTPSFFELNQQDYEAFGYSCGEECSDDSCRSDLHMTSEGMSGEVVYRGVKYIVQPTSPSASSLTEDKFPLEESETGSRRNLQAGDFKPWHDLCIIFEIGPEVWNAWGSSKRDAMDRILELVRMTDDIYRPLGWGFKACGFKFAEKSRKGTKKEIINELAEEDPLNRFHGNAYYYIGNRRTVPGGIASLLGMWWGIKPYGLSMIHNTGHFVLQHELGHTLGLTHTHDRDLDDCNVCDDGLTPQLPPPNGEKGTIMSYCHLCPGIGVKNELHPDSISKLTNGAMWAKLIIVNVPFSQVVQEKKGRFCANEGQPCDCKGTIYYGADMIWRKQFAESDGMTTCSNSVFGDPYIGEEKSCYCDGEQTKFEFVLKHATKNRCLDNPHGTWWGTWSDVYTWDCQKGNRNQIWSYDRISGYLRNSDGLCLDAPWRNSNGEELQMYPCTTWWDNANQQFDLAKNGNTWQLKARHGRCVDYPENENGGKVHIWGCNLSNTNQQWILLDPETMQPLRNIPGEQMDESCAFFEQQSGLQCWDYGNRYLKANEQCQGPTCTRADKDRCCKKPRKYECLRPGQCCLLGTSCHGCPGGDEFEWAWNCGGSRRCRRRGSGCRKRPGDCVFWGSDSYGCPFGSEQVIPSVCGTSRRCKIAPDNRRSLLDTMLEDIEQ